MGLRLPLLSALRLLTNSCVSRMPPTTDVLMDTQTHCLSEFNYQDAMQKAAALDEYWRLHQRPIGPLHGLPVSLMDRFHVAGLDSASGYISQLGSTKHEADEGVLVQRLRSLGAIILCKTNVPMSCMVSNFELVSL